MKLTATAAALVLTFTAFSASAIDLVSATPVERLEFAAKSGVPGAADAMNKADMIPFVANGYALAALYQDGKGFIAGKTFDSADLQRKASENSYQLNDLIGHRISVRGVVSSVGDHRIGFQMWAELKANAVFAKRGISTADHVRNDGMSVQVGDIVPCKATGLCRFADVAGKVKLGQTLTLTGILEVIDGGMGPVVVLKQAY